MLKRPIPMLALAAILAMAAGVAPAQTPAPSPAPAAPSDAAPVPKDAAPAKDADRPPDAPVQTAPPQQTVAPRGDPKPAGPARTEAPPVELGGLLTIAAARDLIEGFGMKVLAENRFGSEGTVPGFQTIGANGVPFWFQLLNCSGEGEAATCPHAQIISCWNAADLPGKKLPEVVQVNAFNARYVFGRAWLVEQPAQLCVNFGVFADGGITRTALRRSMSYWLTVSEEFRRHFGL